MTGAKLQLIHTGQEDIYLHNNPNIFFFKKVYMRHTRFSMNSFNIITDENCDYTSSTKCKISIPRYGDLINHIFFRFNLPTISNGSNGFRFVDNIGSAIIKNVSLYIENTLIETLSGEFIYAYHKLHNSGEKNNIFDKMINPDSPRKTVSNDSNRNDPASILAKTITVPLPFWFHRDNGLAIPLIALSKHRVYIEIELRPIQELFTLFKKESVQLHSDADDDTFERYYSSKPESTDIATYFANHNFDPRFEINYIYLDNRERNQLVKHKQQYLIEQVREFNIVHLSGNKNININLYHPVKEIIIIPKRNDIKNCNQWTNFTNHDYHNIPYKDFQTNYLELSKQSYIKNNAENMIYYLGEYRQSEDSSGNKYTTDHIKKLVDIWKYRKYTDIPSINRSNYKFFSSNIISQMQIKLNNTILIEYKDDYFFSKLQSYLYYKQSSVDDILLYSFSKNPHKFQPSGICNFSSLDKIRFEIKFKQPELFENNPYKYDTNIYFVNYNILHIEGGMGGILYANK